MHDPPAGGGDRRPRHPALFLAFLLLANAPCGSLRADALLPGQCVTAGGGRALGGSNALTSATGQAGAGRATGGSFIEVAGWLCRPANANLGVLVPPPDNVRPELSVRPNPSTGEMQFAIRLPASSAGAGTEPLEVRLYDVTGRLVRVLRAEASAGERLLRWDGRDLRGKPARPGVYLARLRSGGVLLTRRLVLTH